jgi:glycosyltransferase involved in cell wall biosynthesis
MNKKKVIISVTNDLVTDQRVHRVATTLVNSEYDVLLIGRKLPNSLSLSVRPYRTKRMNLLFRKGFLFYAEYNFRLFLYLLFHKADILLSNDLDSLPANYLASKFKNSKLVYDSHEYFTEVPELVDRPFVRNVWLKIEEWILPKVKHSYTVCQSIADEYFGNYGIKMEIVRNVPYYYNTENVEGKSDKKIILYQGALNKGRGLENAILAMKYIDNAILQIIGDGDITYELKQLSKNNDLEDKVHFLGKISFEDVKTQTTKADLGLSIEENIGKNYFYVLPNKLFDYIQAEVPVLVSDFPEMKRIVEKYRIGKTISNTTPESIAKAIKEILEKENTEWKNNLKIAKKDLCWENEEKIIIEIFSKVV